MSSSTAALTVKASDSKSTAVSSDSFATVLADINKLSTDKSATITLLPGTYTSKHIQTLKESINNAIAESSSSAKFNIRINTSDIPKELEQLILDLIQQKKIWCIRLQKPISAAFLDKILDRGMKFPFGVLYFENNEQDLSDAQAKKILGWLKSSAIRIMNLPGKNMSKETADGFLKAEGSDSSKYVDVHGCAYLSNRRRVKFSIAHARYEHSLSDAPYEAADIPLLTTELVRPAKNGEPSYRSPMEFHLFKPGSYQLPEWKTFFTTVLSSDCRVTTLYIPRDSDVSDDVMGSIVTAIGTNQTVTSLTINRFIPNNTIPSFCQSLKTNKYLQTVALGRLAGGDVKQVIDSLVAHPTLTELMLNDSFVGDENGESLKTLVSRSPGLRKLNLPQTGIGDKTISAIADGLAAQPSDAKKDSKSSQSSSSKSVLKELHISSNNISDAGLTALATALTTNESLKELTMVDNPKITSNGLAVLADKLQHNKSVINVGFSYDEKDTAAIKPSAVAIKKITYRNGMFQALGQSGANQTANAAATASMSTSAASITHKF